MKVHELINVLSHLDPQAEWDDKIEPAVAEVAARLGLVKTAEIAAPSPSADSDTQSVAAQTADGQQTLP